MSSDTDFDTASTIVEQLLSEADGNIRRAILYGSRARGAAGPESDYDLLVVQADPVSRREEMRRLRELVRDQHHPVDVWVMGEMEFEETKNVIGGLAYPANKYGIVLYEKS